MAIQNECFKQANRAWTLQINYTVAILRIFASDSKYILKKKKNG